MAIFFQNINVLIDGNPLLVQNAAINFDNNLIPIFPVGFVGSYNQLPTNAIKSSFQLSYLMRMDKDPAYDVTVNLKNYIPQSSSTIVIAGLSGEAFLSSYSIKSTPNQPNVVSVSYDGFLPLSGVLQAKTVELNNSGSFTGISHGWTTFLGDSGNLQTQPIYSLDYNFRVQWQPTFVLGNQKPFQTDFMSASEEIKFTTETFNNLTFSGTNLTDDYVNIPAGYSGYSGHSGYTGPSLGASFLTLYSLALLTNNDQTRFLDFDLLGHKITKTNLTAALDNMVQVEITTAKYY